MGISLVLRLFIFIFSTSPIFHCELIPLTQMEAGTPVCVGGAQDTFPAYQPNVVSLCRPYNRLTPVCSGDCLEPALLFF